VINGIEWVIEIGVIVDKRLKLKQVMGQNFTDQMSVKYRDKALQKTCGLKSYKKECNLN
jgi:hypothetical protein